MDQSELKVQTRQFWNCRSCGESYALGATINEQYGHHRKARYAFEPFIFDFARFYEARCKLSVGDLLMGTAGQDRHGDMLLSAVKAVWPRKLIRRFCKARGLSLLIEAQK